jgi:hypothetical protein
MKVPKSLKLYLLTLEVLPLLDELNANNSLKKAYRTIQGFAADTNDRIEMVGLSDELVSNMYINFSDIIDGITVEHLEIQSGQWPEIMQTIKDKIENDK